MDTLSKPSSPYPPPAGDNKPYDLPLSTYDYFFLSEKITVSFPYPSHYNCKQGIHLTRNPSSTFGSSNHLLPPAFFKAGAEGEVLLKSETYKDILSILIIIFIFVL